MLNHKMDKSVDILESTRKLYSEPHAIKDLSEHGQVLMVQFSTFDWSQDVLLIAFENKIVLAHLDLEDALEIDILSEFIHPCRCTALSISPDTSLSVQPNIVLFCTGGTDFKLRIFNSDLQENNTCKVLPGHSSYINSCTFDHENNYLASVSDDNTAKVWNTEGFKLSTTFNLTSPGMSACWHRSDSCKLLVAEKIGVIRFYNVETDTPILSLDYGKMLSCAHWAPSDSQLVASLQLGELLIWDITKPCFPVHNNLVFSDSGGDVKISPQNNLVAAANSLDGSLRVINVKSQILKLSATVTLPTNITWHYRYPIVCIGDDFKLCFWKVKSK